MDRPVRVAVVSPFEIVRAGVAQLLRNQPERVKLEDVAPHDGHLSSLDAVLFDLAAFDTRRGIGGDLEHLVQGNCVVVGLTHDHHDEHLPPTAMGPPISIRATADELGEHIVGSVEAGTAGGGAGSEHPCRLPRDGRHGHPAGLSDREAQVLAAITQGRTNQEIADEIFLSINSVKTYIRSAYRKIGATSRSQAIAWMYANGLAGNDGARDLRHADG